jgi:hypothetical protein
VATYSWIMTISVHTDLVTNSEVQDLLKKLIEVFPVVWNLILKHGPFSDVLNPVHIYTTRFYCSPC